ncbi:MAG TPA: hypothetical protein VKT73_15075 [Xanthobacteraceae bacterium]|nr:hypothetical protein [Xanthobacteraceae bacterium]
MSFAKEIKDFISAMQAGQKIIGARDDREYKRARARYFNARAGALEGGGGGNSELSKYRQLRNKFLQGKIDQQNGKKGQQPPSTDNVNPDLVGGASQKAKNSIGPQSAIPTIDPTGQQQAGGDQPDLPDEAKPVEYAVGDQNDSGTDTLSQQSAIPDSDANNIEVAEQNNDLEDDGGDVEYAATGGDIEPDDDQTQQVALPTGGEDDSDTDEPELPKGAIPAADSGQQAPPDDTKAGDQPDIPDDAQPARARGFSIQAAHDATKDGLLYGLNDQQEAVPTRSRSRSRAAESQLNAVSPKELEAIKNNIDPDKKMSEGQRNMAALGGVWQYYMEKGDPQKAQKVSAEILQYYKVSAQRYAAYGAVAAQNGDLDQAAKAAMMAYANIPDGRDLKVVVDGDKFAYQYTDENGKLIKKGVATPEEMAAQAMGVARDGFEKFILDAAGNRAGTSNKKGQDSGNVNYTDRGRIDTQVSNAFDDAVNNLAPEGGTPPKIPGRDKTAIKNSAFQIMADPRNKNMNASQAVDASMRLMLPNPKSPDQPDFQVKPGQDGALVQFKDGARVFVPKDQFDQIMTMRNSRIKALQPKTDKPTAAIPTNKGPEAPNDDNSDSYMGGLIKVRKDSPAARYIQSKKQQWDAQGQEDQFADAKRRGALEEIGP